MSVYARPGSKYNPKSLRLHLLRLPDLSCNVSEMQTVIQTAWSKRSGFKIKFVIWGAEATEAVCCGSGHRGQTPGRVKNAASMIMAVHEPQQSVT